MMVLLLVGDCVTGGVGASVVGDIVGDGVVGGIVGIAVDGNCVFGAVVGEAVFGERVKVGDFVRVGEEVVGVMVVGDSVVGACEVGVCEVGGCVFGEFVGANVSKQLFPEYAALHTQNHCPSMYCNFSPPGGPQGGGRSSCNTRRQLVCSAS
ncbi:hypothetical protein CYMTET_43213 [Cymbomonas tetramitiformis]|uniref:Uncharacterized protein n=1 Tax=Cymbomonas tetramitiformis TaxID=36881 RepID=A0AAE0C2N9_9CHLO|nr:hypothetical protein CYMTET_43213 [Cymbomonas tetramitiformis]